MTLCSCARGYPPLREASINSRCAVSSPRKKQLPPDATPVLTPVPISSEKAFPALLRATVLHTMCSVLPSPTRRCTIAQYPRTRSRPSWRVARRCRRWHSSRPREPGTTPFTANARRDQPCLIADPRQALRLNQRHSALHDQSRAVPRVRKGGWLKCEHSRCHEWFMRPPTTGGQGVVPPVAVATVAGAGVGWRPPSPAPPQFFLVGMGMEHFCPSECPTFDGWSSRGALALPPPPPCSPVPLPYQAGSLCASRPTS